MNFCCWIELVGFFIFWFWVLIWFHVMRKYWIARPLICLFAVFGKFDNVKIEIWFFFLAILALSLLIDVVAASSNCDLKSMFTTTNFVLLRLSSFCVCAYSIFFTAVLIIFVKWQLRVQKALQEGTVSWRLSRKLGPDRKRRMFSGPNLVKGLLNQMRNFLATFYWWFSC